MGKGKNKARKEKDCLKNKQIEARHTKAKEREEKEKRKKQRQKEKFKNGYDDEDRKFALQLASIGCRIKFISGDGNCMFRSIADQIEGNPENHRDFRNRIMDHIEAHGDLFALFMEDDEPFAGYLSRMRADRQWGGHQELYAASQLFRTTILVHQYQAPRLEISFEGADGRRPHPLHLSYHGESHYNSVRAVGDPGGGPPLPINLRQSAPPSKRAGGGPAPGGGEGKQQGPGTAEDWELVRLSVPWADVALVERAMARARGEGIQAIELIVSGEVYLEEEDQSPHTSQSESTGEGITGADSKESVVHSSQASNQECNNLNPEEEGDQSSSTSKADVCENGGDESTLSGRTIKNNAVTRGAKCPCGSGLKYKKCCRKRDLLKKRIQSNSAECNDGAEEWNGHDVPGGDDSLQDFGSLAI